MYDERFARQYRYEPPSEFPLTWPCSGIVHHLSGPNRNAQTQTSINQLVGCTCKDPGYHFHCVNSLNTNKLANLLDSLVRVSRRVKQKQLVSIIVPRFTDCSKQWLWENKHRFKTTRHVPPNFHKDMQSKCTGNAVKSLLTLLGVGFLRYCPWVSPPKNSKTVLAHFLYSLNNL